eukprot:3187560-Pyramimonas_sp.AAC.1
MGSRASTNQRGGLGRLGPPGVPHRAQGLSQNGSGGKAGPRDDRAHGDDQPRPPSSKHSLA